MTKRAVLFDLDGTLLNTLDDIAESMNRVLGRMGHPTHPVDAYKDFVGEGVVKLARRALPETAQNEHSVTQCADAMKEEYGRHCHDKTKLYDGIQEMLSGLARRQVKLAILSNKPDALTRKTVSYYLSGWNFSEISGAVPGFPKKPDPAGAIRIAREMDIAAADFLYLGDTGIDMLTATGAGMFAVGALWGFRTEPELLAGGAQAVIERPEDLLRFVEEPAIIDLG